ncbi:hypothetical protein DMH04_24295 [Kibdelosporangium aridum]|uniref:Uncharacterized protein n=1 Tax=Kibdelosporangium aridum TaxID=2030 RepID=A0A428Z6C8_KIBAR|nr:hypothetical protein [Kibdelosporangium aridum]RSM82749.1 hypothetical protein DMH04_24295 [Kibdelosporangium aridum]
MTEADDEREFREELIAESHRVRIPSLPLRVFTMYVGEDDDEENIADDEYHDYLPPDIPADKLVSCNSVRFTSV